MPQMYSVPIFNSYSAQCNPDTAWEIITYFEDINKTGTTIIINTHSKEIVDKMNKRVITFDKGHIIRDSIGGYADEID